MIATVKELDEIDKRIIDLKQQGLVNKEVARQMNLAKKTVDNRLQEMRRYYKCTTTIELLNKVKGTNTFIQQ